MRFDLTDEKWALLEPLLLADTECDLLRAAHWHAVARHAGAVSSRYGGLQAMSFSRTSG
jgi:hypothetical protein